MKNTLKKISSVLAIVVAINVITPVTYANSMDSTGAYTGMDSTGTYTGMDGTGTYTGMDSTSTSSSMDSTGAYTGMDSTGTYTGMDGTGYYSGGSSNNSGPSNNNNNNNNNTGGNNSGSGWSNQSYGLSTPFTYEAGPVNGTTVTLNGMVRSDGLTEVWFEYGTSRENLNNSYGYRLVGNGRYDVISDVPNLSPYTVYYFRLASRNGSNSYYGETKSFLTGRGYIVTGYGKPLAETLPVRYIGQNGAVLVSRINGNGGSTTYWFEYGTSTAPTLWSGRTMAMSVSADTLWYERVFGLTGLASKTTYYYRVVAQNPNGTTYGDIKSFTTLAYGTVVSGASVQTPSTIKKYSGSTSFSTGSDTIISDEDKAASLILDSYVSNEEVNVGDELKLSLTYRNTGSGKANDAILKVALPPEVEFVTSSVTPTSKIGSDLKFMLGSVAGNSQSDITVTVKIKKTVEAGSVVAFNSFLEYFDKDNKLQTVNSFNSVIVKENKASFTGSLAAFAFNSGNIFTIILLLLVLASFVYMIATRRR